MCSLLWRKEVQVRVRQEVVSGRDGRTRNIQPLGHQRRPGHVSAEQRVHQQAQPDPQFQRVRQSLCVTHNQLDLMFFSHVVVAGLRLGIKTIVNLQEPGEHASCGPPLHSSGFSYDPAVFMQNDIFFYNFRWRDYSPSDATALLDMVKVVSFAATEGKVCLAA